MIALGVAAGGAWLFRHYSARPEIASVPASVIDAELAQASQRNALCSDTNARGVGLRGEYFARPGQRDNPLVVRTDSIVDFDPAADFAKEGNAAFGSVRWSGWIKPPLNGRYRFHLGDTPARIIVARQAVAGPDAPADASVELTAGRFAPIVVELDQVPVQGSRVRLEWTLPFGSRFVVPRAAMFLPADTVAPTR